MKETNINYLQLLNIGVILLYFDD